MPELAVFLVVLLGSAAAGDVAASGLVGRRPVLLAGWVGASAGALAPPLALNCLILLPFAVDPYYFLAQDLLIAGAVGGLVDLPLGVRRAMAAGLPVRRAVWHAVAVLAVAGAMAALEVRFRMTYVPVQLPI